MHPYAIDRMVQERRDELMRLGRADRGVRAARHARRRTTTSLPDVLTSLGARLRRRPAPRPTLEPCPRPSARPW